jgi:hypothetical protein
MPHKDIALSPDAAFERDIPAALQDTVMEMMCEAAHANKTTSLPGVGVVHIQDFERRDAINVRVSGTVTLEAQPDRAFDFQLRDGNQNGTELLGWEAEGVQDMEHSTPVQWTLQPSAGAVESALSKGLAHVLLMKWDGLVKQNWAKELVRSYGYDRYVQPGIVVERHYREAAAKHGLLLVDEESAQATRARLTAAG